MNNYDYETQYIHCSQNAGAQNRNNWSINEFALGASGNAGNPDYEPVMFFCRKCTAYLQDSPPEIGRILFLEPVLGSFASIL